ncbi:MAG TPA: UDP-2,3-diacylglucosamine diphosphatase [Verrucomicrobiae bacterium]|nr:UDP-2,3-diacylglucosamine diphosphatase [Verrucomicrobiae bacterium]
MRKIRTETATQRHRTLWLSDMHLGSPGCKAKQIVRFLKQNDCETLYLVGDIFDGWKMQSHFFWTPDHSRVIKAILAKARRGTEVYYLTGNHDAFMRQFVKKRLDLGRIRVAHELIHTTADGRRLLVQHGDQYDAVIRNLPGLALAGDFAYETLLKASEWLGRSQKRYGVAPGFSLSAFAKYRVKSLVQYLSGFDDAVYYQCRKRGLAGLISGHTHHAETRHIRNGIVSYNCGDWVESCTALAEDKHGHIRILDGTADRPARAPLKLVKDHPVATVTREPIPEPGLRPAAEKIPNAA